MTRLLIAVAVMLVALGPGTPAWAHATLVSTDPAKGATLTSAPTAVTLEFNERLNPDFTTIVVSDAARQPVAASPATVDTVRGMLTLTGALSNGGYTVAYRVVSVDGHTVQGSYPFTLADPELPAAVPASASAAAVVAGDAQAGGGFSGGLVGAGAGGVALAAVAVGWYLVARRRPAHR